MAPSAASWSISWTGTPRWKSHSLVISSPVQSRIGFFDVVSGAVGEEGIEPYDGLMFGLLFEVGLTVDRPAEKP